MSCRINKTRLWAGRILMESYFHPTDCVSFVTFTYRDDALPVGGSLDPAHALAFRKALYKRHPGVRYFWVGEYGDLSFRPHYHAILFGVPPAFDLTPFWPHGHVLSLPFSSESATYVAGYCTKKLTSKSDIRLESRHPEFSQMSRRPALGDAFVQKLAETVEHHVRLEGDVPGAFRAYGGVWPLGNRHRRMLRRLAGIPELSTTLRLRQPDRFRAPEPFPEPDELRARRQREVQRESKAKIYRRAL